MFGQFPPSNITYILNAHNGIYGRQEVGVTPNLVWNASLAADSQVWSAVMQPSQHSGGFVFLVPFFVLNLLKVLELCMEKIFGGDPDFLSCKP